VILRLAVPISLDRVTDKKPDAVTDTIVDQPFRKNPLASSMGRMSRAVHGDFSKYFRDAHVRIRTNGDGTAECEYLDQDGNPVSVTMRVSP